MSGALVTGPSTRVVVFPFTTITLGGFARDRVQICETEFDVQLFAAKPNLFHDALHSSTGIDRVVVVVVVFEGEDVCLHVGQRSIITVCSEVVVPMVAIDLALGIPQLVCRST